MEKIIIDPMKKITLLERTESSYPMNACDRCVNPIRLKDYGYQEDEYRIEGNARIYSWPKEEKYASVESHGGPYVSRCLIRKPIDSSRFSGRVIVEMFNWARNYDRPIDAWGNCYEYIMENNDIWVGVTCRDSVCQTLKRFDPERYSGLGFPNPRPKEEWELRPQANPFHDIISEPSSENGLIWDMYSQLGILLREDSERNPLYGYHVEKIIGTSALPGDISTYVAAIDPICTDEKGRNIFDGFLIFMTGAPGGVNQYEPKVEPEDERCKFYGKVPLIRVYTCGDMLGVGHHPDWAVLQRHEDADGPDRYFRSYELPGPNLFLKYVRGSEPRREDLEKAGIEIRGGRAQGNWSEKELQSIEFPTRYVLWSAFENLFEWIDGTIPPASKLIEMEGEYPDIDFRRDEYGNVCGGVRTPYLDVPLFHFDYQSNAVLLEADVLKKLYPSHDVYVNKVINNARECVENRMILEEDARRIIDEAKTFQFI